MYTTKERHTLKHEFKVGGLLQLHLSWQQVAVLVVAAFLHFKSLRR